MKKKTLDEKVALLKAGQRVMINGHCFSAKRINQAFRGASCLICNVDCLCNGDITKVCCELNYMSKTEWYLYLES